MQSFRFIILISSVLWLQACVHHIVTVPAKIVYSATKGVVKGTAAVGRAIIPGDSDDKEDEDD